jgi:hypothetical protein
MIVSQGIGMERPAGKLRTLFDQFCGWKGEFAAHAMFGQLSTSEWMRHAYLHLDHHLRQFGA